MVDSTVDRTAIIMQVDGVTYGTMGFLLRTENWKRTEGGRILMQDGQRLFQIEPILRGEQRGDGATQANG